MRALVTGASSGIGREIARLLDERGLEVVIVARSLSGLEDTASGMARATILQADLGTPEGRRSVVAAVPHVDVLVNAAGFGVRGPLAESDEEAVAQMVEVNCVALMELTRAYLPSMLAARTGQILNISSSAAFGVGTGMAVYFATKAAIVTFTESVAEELHGTGVDIVAFCPGGFASGFQSVAFGEPLGPEDLATMPTAAEMADAAIAAMDRADVVATTERMVWLSSFAMRHLPRSIGRRILHFVS